MLQQVQTGERDPSVSTSLASVCILICSFTQVWYCSSACQLAHWKAGHHRQCSEVQHATGGQA